MSSPRRLGYVISGREQYGPRRAALGLCDELRARGWAVHIYAIEDGPFARELREQRYPCDALSERGIPLVGGSPAARAAGALRMLRGARALRAPLAQRIARDRVDLLHVRWPNLVAIAGHAAHSAGVPTIWQLPNIVGDGHPFDLNKRFFRRLCRTRSVLPLGNSLYTARTLGGDIEPRFLHLAVDQTLFDPDRYTPGVDGAPTRADVGLPDGAIVLGIFARISPQKGADRIARAIALLGDTPRPVYLLLLGAPTEGGFADDIRRVAREAGVGDRVVFGGSVPDPASYFPLIDLAINARPDPEPFGLSVVEALMMRTPIVVHALGGPAETVDDGVTGWHVPDPSPGSFAGTLRRAIDARERWPAMGEAARAQALERFSLPAHTRAYEDLANRLLAGAFPDIPLP